ncbi:MAG: transposase [Arcobacter sp.]|nr:MAG: transposase [Arcobacter sp.]
MARIQILSKQEEKIFNEPPDFLPNEQKYYFKIPTKLLDQLYTNIAIENIGYVILQYGYLKANNKFFETHKEPDIQYIKDIYMLKDLNINIPKRTKQRYHSIIKEYIGIQLLTASIKLILQNEAISMANNFQDRRKIFWTLVNISKNVKIEIPSYTELVEIIATALNHQKSFIIEKLKEFETSENLKQLDIFVEKNSKFKNKYNIGSFKRLEHSTARSKILKSLSHHQTIQSKFRLNKQIIEAIGISSEIAQYYAKWINKSRVHQLTRKNTLDTYFTLLSFIYYQYFIRNDNLIDRFIGIVQSAKNSSIRAQKDSIFQQSSAKNNTITSLENTSLEIVNNIKNITQNPNISAVIKVKLIDDYINKQTQILAKILSNNKTIESDMDSKYNFIESKSKVIQGKLSGILKVIEFDEVSSNKDIIIAINYFKNNTNINEKAPRAFLDNQEQEMIFNNGKFKISLYKILLFFAVSNNIKSGTLNLKYSYRYQSFEKYLINKEAWEKSKDNLLKAYKIEHLKDFSSFMNPIIKKLDDSYKNTNYRIINQLNSNFKFNNDSFILKTPAIERLNDEDNISKYLPSSNYISIIDILNMINKQTQFLDPLTHFNIKNKNKVSIHLLLAAILGYGCNINISKIAKISKGINPNQLDNTKTWYFTEDNTIDANDKIIAFMDNLEIVKLLRNQENINHTSSDGQKYNMKPSVESTNAGYSFKYFGTQKGVSVYTFIDESHRLFYSTVINVSERESGYVIDGLMHNDVIKSDIHSTDTHGFSEVIFGLTHLLGFSFAPRIKNFKDQQLYAFKSRKEYLQLGYDLLPKRKINTIKMEENWDDILRFIVTIKSKKTSASQLLRRLTSYSKQHKLYAAIKEFGKIIKTDFLLNYIDDVELRQRIEKQLNKVESSNKFSKAVFFGNNTEFTVATIEEQNIANNCKRLIQNSIILWNYLYMSQKLNITSNKEEKKEIIKTIRQSSIMHWSHINFYGEYDFTKLNRKNSAYLKDMDYLKLDIL